MKRLIGFLFGLATMVMVFGAIYVAASIYDTTDKFVIEPYFLRTGARSSDLPGLPKSLAEVGKRKMRDWLIQKYVTEYFYIVPDAENINRRMTAAFNSPLYIMSSPAAFAEWRQKVAPEMRNMAEDGVRRTVTVFNEIFKPDQSDYWRVDYELKTWYKPNDVSEVPEITRGTMYLDIGGDMHIDTIGNVKQPIEEVQAALKRGIDPAAVFVFTVRRVLDEKR